MLIFGWGHRTTKHLGPTFQNHCNHCNNEQYWVLTKFMDWLTLFFIPVFPYSTKYFLSCPICQYGLALKSEQTEKIKPLAEANQLLIDGKITEAEHKTRINQLGSGSATRVEAETVEPKALVGGDDETKFCSECGTKLMKEMKFCGNCGAKI